ncbi:hypothetical protein [Kutzneria sp. NPDC051319]|uniref:hypothetical protein n=1 Tax=Kutzneria sp. NPDC051319 TaxID=3155047 RepID=UPI0034388641
MSLNLRNGATGENWAGMVPLIRAVGPDVLLVQEAVGWYTPDDPGITPNEQLITAGHDLEMRGKTAPSRTGFHTGIFLDRTAVNWGEWITKYNHTSLHGHAELTVGVPGLSEPLAVISAHLTPYSARTAAEEAAVLVARAHRAGGLGLIAGDINHIPPGDEPPPWDEIPAHDRSARSVVSDPELRPDHSVGYTLARGRLVDVAGHLADIRSDPSLRRWTGHVGKVRTDQVHLTERLVPALVDYWTVPMEPWSDHDGVVVTLDVGQLAG